MIVNDKRALAHVEEIMSLSPIEGADRIEVAQVLGWKVVVKKGEFQVGDKVVYIEIDSRVPADNSYFSFLQDRKYKVKTIKLRGQISQGLIVPLDVLPRANYNVGDDVTEILGITKIEDVSLKKEIDTKEVRLRKSHKKLAKQKWFKYMMRFSWFRELAYKFLLPKKKKSGWPTWVVKTDSERIQNMPWILKNKDTKFFVSEKCDGSSTTFTLYKDKGKLKFMVCSRNVVQDTPDKKSYLNDVNGIEGNAYWEVAFKYDIEKKMRELFTELGAQNNLTIQGELIGPGVQKNKYQLKEREFKAFNLYVDEKYINLKDMEQIMKSKNIPTVPMIDFNYTLPDTLEELMKYSTGKSQLYNTLREGYVFKNYDGSINFKCVSDEFLLKWNL